MLLYSVYALIIKSGVLKRGGSIAKFIFYLVKLIEGLINHWLKVDFKVCYLIKSYVLVQLCSSLII